MMLLNSKAKRIQMIKVIERHLRNYKTYEIGIKNLKKQLDYIMPNVTASYELVEGSSGTFNIASKTEGFAIDRIESRRALELYEDIKQYQMILDAIDEALSGLEEAEREFIRCRYMENMTIPKTAMQLGYSEKHIFNIRNSAFGKLLISLKGILQF